MAGYIGTTPVPQATQHRESFTATGGQTSFATVGYTPQFIDVYLNGVKLAPADFTATNGSDVVLASGATASDILEIVAYTPFEVANQTFTGTTTAANLTVTGAFTSQGIDDNADAVAITIDSSENVGIGTSSPAEKLSVEHSGDVAIEVKSTGTGDADASVIIDAADTGEAVLEFRQGGAAKASIEWFSAGSPDFNFRTEAGTNGVFDFQPNNSLAMRIDSSGNLLVGTTNTNIVASSTATDEGFVYVNGSALTVARSAGHVADFNRITNDGEIIRFRKDGATVGNIGTRNGTSLEITSPSSVELKSSASGTAKTIYYSGTHFSPFLADTASVDLGMSNRSWKDLYLSGGVYLGGTGSANKLDDYEEGTWTPAAQFTDTEATAGISTGDGRYVKIGGVVTIWYNLGNINVTGASGSLYITGLPFAMIGDAPLALASGTVRARSVTLNNTLQQFIPDANSYIAVEYLNSNTSTTRIQASHCTHGQSDFSGTLTYPVL